MIRKILFLTVFIAINILGQSIENIKENYLKRIQIKIANDINYLDVYQIDLTNQKELLDDFWNSRIINSNIGNGNSNSTQFKAYFKSVENNTDSLIILSILRIDQNEVSNSPDSISSIKDSTTNIGVVTEDSTKISFYSGETEFDTTFVSFALLFKLKASSDSIFEKVYKAIEDEWKSYNSGIRNQEANIIEPLLAKELDKIQNKSQEFINTDVKNRNGYSSRNNTQFLDYQRLNNKFLYPSKSLLNSISNGNLSNLTLAQKRGNQKNLSNFHIDFSFSRITFYHDWMNNFLGKGESNNGLALEISTEEELLNILPYTGLSLTFALRSLFTLGNNSNKDNNYYLDTRIFYKARANTAKLVENLPFITASRPNLNLGNRLGIEFTMTKQLSLPYLNFYLALGGKNFQNPYVGFFDGTNIYSYFSITQASATMSFYWNTSRDDVHRFRLDIGGGYYDKFKVFYNINGGVTDIVKQDGEIQPILILYFNFVPEHNDLFGIHLKVFNSIGELSGWIKLLDFKEINSTLRFQATYISRPMGRQLKEWESKGGAIFQLRFRYGMNNFFN